jgi:hypothetical protein
MESNSSSPVPKLSAPNPFKRRPGTERVFKREITIRVFDNLSRSTLEYILHDGDKDKMISEGKDRIEVMIRRLVNHD